MVFKMKGQISILAVILIIGIVGSSGFSGYLYIQNTNLQNKVQTLSKDKDALKNKVSTLYIENQRLSKDKDVLKKHVEKLNYTIMTLNNSKTILEKRVKDLNITYHSLLSRYNILNTSHYQLLSEYNSLNTTYTKLKNKYSDLKTRYNTLLNNYSKILDAYNKLQIKYQRLQTAYNSSSRDYLNLLNNYDILNESYQQLQQEYNILQDKYNSLQQNYSHLESEYNNLWQLYQGNMDSEFRSLVENYEKWYEYAMGVIYFTNETIPRIYSLEQYNYLYNVIVNNVRLTNSSDWWLSVYELYQYVNKTVQYVWDEPEPIPPYIQDLINGVYKNVTIDNSIMKPSKTLELGQGDCDDQATLLYGLIVSYEKYIYGNDCIEWIVYVEFNDGSGHLTVFTPVKGGNLTITDPAGQYLTLDQNGHLISNSALQELQKYSDWWSDHGGIKYIELYEIHDNKVYIVASGSIYDIADYIVSVTS